MNFVISKINPRFQYRVYPDSTEVEGQIIFEGHKMSPNDNLLSEVLDWRTERSTGKILFLKYDKVIDGPNHLDLSQWEIGKMESISKNLLDSWISLLSKLRHKVGDFRKIRITKIYI